MKYGMFLFMIFCIWAQTFLDLIADGKDEACVRKLASAYREDLMAAVCDASPAKNADSAAQALCQALSLQGPFSHLTHKYTGILVKQMYF